MNIYAESSAVLGWLLKESSETAIYPLLAGAEEVVASDLTLVECDRSIWRAVATGALVKAEVGEVRKRLSDTAQHWTILPIYRPIIERARGQFPDEPIRALDALHIASALHARVAFPDLALLSLDERVRRVARSLGLSVIPS